MEWERVDRRRVFIVQEWASVSEARDALIFHRIVVTQNPQVSGYSKSRVKGSSSKIGQLELQSNGCHSWLLGDGTVVRWKTKQTTPNFKHIQTLLTAVSLCSLCFRKQEIVIPEAVRSEFIQRFSDSNPRSLCQPEAGEWSPFLQFLDGTQTENTTGLSLGGIRLFLLYIAFFKWMFFNISIFHMDPQLVEAKQTLTDCTITKRRNHS